MRLLLGLFLLSSALHADPLNGITWTWHYGTINNISESIIANLSQPITSYTLFVEISNTVQDPVLYGPLGPTGTETITWLTPYTAQMSGTNPILYNGPEYGGDNAFVLQLSYTEFTGPGIEYFTFLSLARPDTPPGSGITQVPEPAPSFLAALGLSALLLSRRFVCA